MEQVGAGPVEDGHEVVADDLDTELGQVADALLVVLDVLIAGGQADLDVVVDVDRLDNVHVEAVSVDLVCDLLDLVDLPDLAGASCLCSAQTMLVTPGDLLDVAEGDGVVALAIPAPTHFIGTVDVLRSYLLLRLCAAGVPRSLTYILIYQLQIGNSRFAEF